MRLAGWWSDEINGIRGGFGEEAIAIRVAVAASVRRRSNWIFPGLLTVLLVGANVVHTIFAAQADFPLLIFRIILFDYFIFFLGWLAGWNAASRWRDNQDFISELTITPLSPAVVGNLLFAGSLGIWWRCFLILMLTDFLLHVGLLWTTAEESTFWMIVPFYVAAYALALVPLAWFHLETMRLAYWMFAITALPGLNLVRRAIVMFVQIVFFVTALTALGSAITGTFVLLGLLTLAIGGELLQVMALPGGSFERFMQLNPNPIWHLGAVAALIGVGILKRTLTQTYEKAFWARYMMFTWWGSGERDHPGEYPAMYRQRSDQYVRHLTRKESAEGHRQMKQKPPEDDQPG